MQFTSPTEVPPNFITQRQELITDGLVVPSDTLKTGVCESGHFRFIGSSQSQRYSKCISSPEFSADELPVCAQL
jgi:hypothetical protein